MYFLMKDLCVDNDRAHECTLQVHEACLLALGSLVEAVKAGSCQFDAQPFTETVILPTLSTVGENGRGVCLVRWLIPAAPPAYPLLLGRCLWLAGKMCSLLKPDTVTQYVESGSRPVLVTTATSSSLPLQSAAVTGECTAPLPALSAACAGSQGHLLVSHTPLWCVCVCTHVVCVGSLPPPPPSFCSELRGSESASLLIPFLPSLLSCLSDMAADSADTVLLVVVDALQLTAQVREGGGRRDFREVLKVLSTDR